MSDSQPHRTMDDVLDALDERHRRDLEQQLATAARPAAPTGSREHLEAELALGWSGEYDDGNGHRSPATVYVAPAAARTIAERVIRVPLNAHDVEEAMRPYLGEVYEAEQDARAIASHPTRLERAYRAALDHLLDLNGVHR